MKQKRGFTIVELLIVVVVIAVLAAITTIAYNGIAGQARQSGVDSSVKDAAKKVQLFAVENNDTPPDSLSQAGLSNTGSVKYRYTKTGDKTYCVTAINGDTSSYITDAGVLQKGRCEGHDYVEVIGLMNTPVLKGGADIEAVGYGNGDEGEVGASVEVVQGQTPISGLDSFIRITNTSEILATKTRPSSSYAQSNFIVSISSNIKDRVVVGSHGGIFLCSRTSTINGTYSHYASAHLAGSAWGLGSGHVNLWADGQWSCAGNSSVQGGLPSVGAAAMIARADLYVTLARRDLSIPAGVTIDLAVAQVYVADGPITNIQYWDGDSASWIWNGTPHSSTSTGPMN